MLAQLNVVVSNAGSTGAAQPETNREKVIGWWGIFFVAAASLFLGLRSSTGFLYYDVRSVALTVFQVSGTMVALAIPAVELIFGSIPRLRDLLKLEAGSSDDPKTQNEKSLAHIRETKQSMYSIKKAIVFVFAAFVMSGVAMVSPTADIPLILSMSFSFDELLSAASLVTLIFGSCWFYPATKHAFQFSTIKEVESLYENAIANYNPPGEPPPAGGNAAATGTSSPKHTAPAETGLQTPPIIPEETAKEPEALPNAEDKAEEAIPETGDAAEEEGDQE